MICYLSLCLNYVYHNNFIFSLKHLYLVKICLILISDIIIMILIRDMGDKNGD